MLRVTTQEMIETPTLQVEKTEMLLVLLSFLNHISDRKMEKFVQMLKLFFPDSSTPDKLQSGKIKLGYFIQCLWYCTKMYQVTVEVLEGNLLYVQNGTSMLRKLSFCE